MGCKLSISVVHPESIVKKIKESISPKANHSKKTSPPKIITKPKPQNPDYIIDSPKSLDEYETIFIDSP